MHVFVNICMCLGVFVYMCEHWNMCLCMCTHECACMNVSLKVYPSMCVYLCALRFSVVCVCIYMRVSAYVLKCVHISFQTQIGDEVCLQALSGTVHLVLVLASVIFFLLWFQSTPPCLKYKTLFIVHDLLLGVPGLGNRHYMAQLEGRWQLEAAVSNCVGPLT